jgi:hypothetical protein
MLSTWPCAAAEGQAVGVGRHDVGSIADLRHALIDVDGPSRLSRAVEICSVGGLIPLP